MHWLRKIFGIRAQFSKEDAVKLAREHCRARQLPWREPCCVKAGLTKYTVITAADRIGGNFWIDVDCRTGEVTSTTGPIPL